MQANEKLLRGGVFKLEKFRDGEDTPFEVLTFDNLIVNTGGAALLDLLIGAGGTAFNNANAHIGVGDSSTAALVGQIDLQAATNKLRKAQDATFPSRSGQTITFKSTFGTADANYAWNEVGVFNASTAGTMLCRAVGTFGTKAAGTTWQMTYTVTVP